MKQMVLHIVFKWERGKYLINLERIVVVFLFGILIYCCQNKHQSANSSVEEAEKGINVYLESRQVGIEAYNEQRYEYALQCFTSVEEIAPVNNDLKEWINKCQTKLLPIMYDSLSNLVRCQFYHGQFDEAMKTINTMNVGAQIPADVQEIKKVICDVMSFKDADTIHLYEIIKYNKNKKDLYGYADATGKVIIQYKWLSCRSFSEGLAAVQDINGKWGFIDSRGNVVVPCVWKKVGTFHEGLAAVSDDSGKWGYIDCHGNVVIPCKWKEAYSLSEGLARVYDGNAHNFINRNGDIVIQPNNWQWAEDFSEGLACVVNSKHKRGFIDKYGKIVIPCKWELCQRNFSEGLASFRDENTGKWGYIDKTGRTLIECKWNSAGEFHEGLADVKDSRGKWGYINKNGEVIISGNWENVHFFSEGLARVNNCNHVSGYINKAGELVIPYKWDGDGFYGDGSFNKGLARVADKHGFGYIDNTGRMLFRLIKW